MTFRHSPAVVSGRPSWIVSEVDDEAPAGTPERIAGIRAESAENALARARAGNGTFEPVRSIDIRNRALPQTPVQSYAIHEPEDRDHSPEVRLLAPVGPPIHRRDICEACHAERGHVVKLPPPLPAQNASAR
jgi:hypothetical protein